MHAAQHDLHIHLGAAAPGGRAVHIDNRRPLQAMRLLEGRTPAQALQVMPLLFNLCGHAQSAAARDALRNALSPFESGQRHRLHRQVQLETVREHLLQVHRDWPRLCGTQPHPAHLGDIVRLTDAAAAHPAALDALIDWVRRNTLGLPPIEFLAFDAVAPLRRWARTTEAAAPRGLCALSGMAASVRAVNLPTLESLPPELLCAPLAADATLDFVRQPTHAGVCLETGPAGRHRDHVLVRSAADQGLTARLAARLVDLCATLVALRQDTAPPPLPRAAGLGWVDSARGRLVHHVEMDGQERIACYRILAPTEWNAHPQGLAARLLAGIAAGAPATVQRQAGLVIQTIDPCVQASLRIAAPHVHREPTHA